MTPLRVLMMTSCSPSLLTSAKSAWEQMLGGGGGGSGDDGGDDDEEPDDGDEEGRGYLLHWRVGDGRIAQQRALRQRVTTGIQYYFTNHSACRAQGRHLPIKNRHFSRADGEDVVEEVFGSVAGVALSVRVEAGGARVEAGGARVEAEAAVCAPEFHFSKGDHGRHVEHLGEGSTPVHERAFIKEV